MRAISFYGPPGTGKTETLIREARSLLHTHKICFVSHTRAAAEECVARIGDQKHGRTLHSLAYAIANVAKASVITKGKLASFAEYVGTPVGIETEDGEGDIYLSVYHYARSVMRPINDVYDEFGRPGHYAGFSSFIQSYRSWKEAFGLVDFTDMIERALRVPYKPPFNALLVDESQDLSPLQWKLVEKLATSMGVVMIAGDDDQTIYQWSGADPHGMDEFDKRNSSTRNILSQSHRVPRETFMAADSIIKRVKRRVPKAYKPRDFQGKIQRYASIEQVNLNKEMMVLCRDRYKVAEVEQILITQGIPYRLHGAQGFMTRGYAKAMEVWRKLESGSSITDGERQSLFLACDKYSQRLVGDLRFKDLLKRGWLASIPMPPKAVEYFSMVRSSGKPRVHLSTIHAAKGKEAKEVVLYTASSQKTVDAFFVNPDSEHRLFYVGVTRASEKLHIVEGTMGYEV